MFDFIIDYYPMFLKGTGVTILLALLTVLFGTLIGVLVSITRFNNKGFFGKILNKLADVYIAFFRGTPLMIQLFIFWFGIPQLFHIRLKPVGPIPAEFIIGAIALAINSGAYVAEIFRAGIQAVDKGQMEAARSLGMKKSTAMMLIVIPQAVKNILPAIGNEFVAIIKESSMASIIGVNELMFAGKVVVGSTYLGLEPYIVAAGFYFIMTFTLGRIISLIERRMKKSDSR